MRYRVNRIIVKSENAAKSVFQQSKFFVEEIRNLEPVSVSMDYGCGKLRYLKVYSKISDEVYLHDSEIQLFRQQSIFGKKQSIAQYAKHKNYISLFGRHDVTTKKSIFDRIFCINVMSAIPILSVRWRVLKNCFRLLKAGGELVITHQYRNSDFTRMRNLPNAYEYRDGFVINSLRGHSFYSTFSRETLIRRIEEYGFRIQTTKIYDGTIFIVAMKDHLRCES